MAAWTNPDLISGRFDKVWRVKTMSPDRYIIDRFAGYRMSGEWSFDVVVKGGRIWRTWQTVRLGSIGPWRIRLWLFCRADKLRHLVMKRWRRSWTICNIFAPKSNEWATFFTQPPLPTPWQNCEILHSSVPLNISTKYDTILLQKGMIKKEKEIKILRLSETLYNFRRSYVIVIDFWNFYFFLWWEFFHRIRRTKKWNYIGRHLQKVFDPIHLFIYSFHPNSFHEGSSKYV